MKKYLKSMAVFFRYNAGSIFAGKFIYFLVMAIVLFLVVTVIYSVNSDTAPGAAAVYYFLMAPGVLLVFYPSAYSIQGDSDARMLETLFGIPDYRFKVWLTRSLTQYIVIGVLLMMLALLCRLALADFSVPVMTIQLMFPVAFIGSFGFMTASITRSGNSTAVIMVVLILFFWLGNTTFEGSSWNLFHNPYTVDAETSSLLGAEISFYNRVYLAVGAVVSTMFGLLRLQQREKFF
jgi:hypothetical protein